MPAKSSIFLHSDSITSPVPLGAGNKTILELPHLPSTLKGIEWASLHAQSKLPQPLSMLIILSLASLNAFSLAGRVSLLFPYPKPTCPEESPTTVRHPKLGT